MVPFWGYGLLTHGHLEITRIARGWRGNTPETKRMQHLGQSMFVMSEFVFNRRAEKHGKFREFIHFPVAA